MIRSITKAISVGLVGLVALVALVVLVAPAVEDLMRDLSMAHQITTMEVSVAMAVPAVLAAMVAVAMDASNHRYQEYQSMQI